MAKPKVITINYTELSKELAEVMARLEQGDLDVDQAVQTYDRGLQIVEMLEAHLLEAENIVIKLKAQADASEVRNTQEDSQEEE
jgi:exodeoxyribonuclease VII small subunit